MQVAIFKFQGLIAIKWCEVGCTRFSDGNIYFLALQPGVEPGDVILVLQQKDHDLFTRQGDDLFMTKKLHLTEALCGFHMVIKHLDKRNLVVKYPAGQVIEPGVCSFCAEYFR